ncbi:MAG: c-type cytochrome [Asticcacaulis sp.]
MTRSSLLLLSAVLMLGACHRGGSEGSSADMAMADPPEYSPAQKAAIVATFPAPFNKADLEAGEKQFNKCRSCHTITPDGMNMTGPHLYGVFGRHAATAKGYTYSDAMKAHNVVWDFGTLDIYLKSPQTVVKGTKMGFMGIENDTDRHNLIAYLKLETTPVAVAKSSATDSQ